MVTAKIHISIGIDHVGISSDFDGGGGIDGWNSAAEAFNVTLELVRRGYTEEQIGKLWSGNKSRPRTYSEYWTLIRGSSRKGPARRDPNCPHCGAPPQPAPSAEHLLGYHPVDDAWADRG